MWSNGIYGLQRHGLENQRVAKTKFFVLDCLSSKLYMSCYQSFMWSCQLDIFSLIPQQKLKMSSIKKVKLLNLYLYGYF